MPTETEDKIVTLATYYDPMLAEIIRTRLEDSGIPCFIADANMIGINPLYNNALGGIKLKVFERDIEKCREILADQDTEVLPQTETLTAESTDAHTCPSYCGSDNTRYGDATEKKYGVLSMFISFMFLVLPFYSRKKWHCFNCGKDFE